MKMEISTRSDLAEFFHKFYPPLYQFVSAMMGRSRADVEDVVQETLLQAWKSWGQYRGDAAPFSWVLSIARNRVVDLRRSAGRRGRAREVLEHLRRMDEAPIPQKALQMQEMQVHVRMALQRMDAKASDLLIRRYYEGRSIRSIAREMEESESAITSRLHEARILFRRELQRKGMEDVGP